MPELRARVRGRLSPVTRCTPLRRRERADTHRGLALRPSSRSLQSISNSPSRCAKPHARIERLPESNNPSRHGRGKSASRRGGRVDEPPGRPRRQSGSGAHWPPRTAALGVLAGQVDVADRPDTSQDIRHRWRIARSRRAAHACGRASIRARSASRPTAHRGVGLDDDLLRATGRVDDHRHRHGHRDAIACSSHEPDDPEPAPGGFVATAGGADSPGVATRDHAAAVGADGK